ncbi:uncharacterized protein LOC117550378 [Scomber scombrus]|uniref:Uncharacterized protein LOC117550378 n=1 Tax=Scomber scombrus TaxID=13677 RepID=A0AAV1Q051_SCOSC
MDNSVNCTTDEGECQQSEKALAIVAWLPGTPNVILLPETLWMSSRGENTLHAAFEKSIVKPTVSGWQMQICSATPKASPATCAVHNNASMTIIITTADHVHIGGTGNALVCPCSLYESFIQHNVLQINHRSVAPTVKSNNVQTDIKKTSDRISLHEKDPSLTEEEKRSETASYILHRRRARVFYDLLAKVDHDAVTLCFDMMQNVVLPRTPIGQAYHSRQLYVYVFGVIIHHGKGSKQTVDNVYRYTWMEHEN